MGISSAKGPDPGVKKTLTEIQEELENQKKSAKINLIIGIVLSGLFGYVLGKFL